MTVVFNQLEMTPDEAAADQNVVERMAYFNWLNAGRPEGRCLEFWLTAEREWIERCYVPRREFAVAEALAAVPGEDTATRSVEAKTSLSHVPA